MTEPTSRPLTYEDYVLIPNDGMQHEIIEGEHYVTAAPRTSHQFLLGRLHVAFELARRQREDEGAAAGSVLLSPIDVVFSQINVVQPDLLYFTDERTDVITEANIQGSPSLAIEILSPSTRRKDEVVKRDLYEKFDVDEYWIVDPELESVKIYRRNDDGRFDRGHVLEARHGESVSTPLLPGLRVSLADLFD